MSFVIRTLRILLLLALAATTASAGVAHDGPYGSQPLVRLPNGRVGVMVHVNGKGPFLFCLDTGTSRTVFTPALRQRLGLIAMRGEPVRVVTAAGWTVSQYYAVEEVATAGAIVEGERAVVVDLPGALGVWGALGGDFLSNFIVDLDLRQQVVRLYPLGANLSLAGLGHLNGRFDQHGVIIVPALVDGITADAIIDTGAQVTIANLLLAAATRHETVAALEPQPSSILDAERRQVLAPTIGFKRIRLGPAVWINQGVVQSDLPGFAELGMNKRPAILFGMDLLAARRIVLDYGSGALWLEP